MVDRSATDGTKPCRARNIGATARPYDTNLNMKLALAALALVGAAAIGCAGSTESSTPTADAGSTPVVDSGTGPVTDAGSAPVVDSGTGPVTDAGSTPTGSDSGSPNPTADSGAPACTTKTYANFGQAFFQSKCNGCHSVQNPRLTSVTAIRSNLALCKSEITAGSMPKGTSLSAQEKADVLQWLNCGAP
jgi:hypothetical protein